MSLVRTTTDLIGRAYELRNDYANVASTRTRVRAIMNGGADAIKALLGEHVADPDLPWPNLLSSGLTRLAQKIGHPAAVRVPIPPHEDSQAARERAERKEMAVEAYDELARLELQLPQIGRWLPGYGFAPWVIVGHLSPDGDPYPRIQLRDPFDSYPAPWGPDQQPQDVAVWRTITISEAKRRWPEKETLIDARYQGTNQFGWGGADGLGAAGRFENPQSRGIPLIEYWCEDGTYVILPDLEEEGQMDYVPNPLDSGPMFVVPKRFAFDQLVGQYDHSIGLIVAMAKINIMSILAMQDSVFTETNVIGDKPLGGQYKKGRKQVNYFPPGTRVEKPTSNLPYQLFEQINRIERQFRLVAGYPVTDDAQSPLNWATGQGLAELQTAVNAEVDEYHKVIRWALQDLDAKRLEWDEKVSPNRRKVLAGYRRGSAFSVTYTPARDIRGNYRTRRTHGAMASWDDSAKIVAGLQLLSADVIDVVTLRENLSGLDNLSVIEERVNDKKAADALRDALVFAAQNGDPRAIMALIEMLPEGEQKQVFQKFFTPSGPEMSPEEAAMAGAGQADPMAELFANGQRPDITTVLSRITSGGAPAGGVQTVSRV